MGILLPEVPTSLPGPAVPIILNPTHSIFTFWALSPPHTPDDSLRHQPYDRPVVPLLSIYLHATNPILDPLDPLPSPYSLLDNRIK